MLYLKERTGEGRYTIIELTYENVFSICPVCGEETQVDIENLIVGEDFDYRRSVCCPVCTAKIREEGLAAVMEEHKERLSNTLKEI